MTYKHYIRQEQEEHWIASILKSIQVLNERERETENKVNKERN